MGFVGGVSFHFLTAAHPPPTCPFLLVINRVAVAVAVTVPKPNSRQCSEAKAQPVVFPEENIRLKIYSPCQDGTKQRFDKCENRHRFASWFPSINTVHVALLRWDGPLWVSTCLSHQLLATCRNMNPRSQVRLYQSVHAYVPVGSRAPINKCSRLETENLLTHFLFPPSPIFCLVPNAIDKGSHFCQYLFFFFPLLFASRSQFCWTIFLSFLE